jgi:hypothetical protein
MVVPKRSGKLTKIEGKGPTLEACAVCRNWTPMQSAIGDVPSGSPVMIKSVHPPMDQATNGSFSAPD